MFQQLPGVFSVTGTLLISTAVFSSGAKKMLQNLPADHRLRKAAYLRCFFQNVSNDGYETTALNNKEK